MDVLVSVVMDVLVSVLLNGLTTGLGTVLIYYFSSLRLDHMTLQRSLEPTLTLLELEAMSFQHSCLFETMSFRSDPLNRHRRYSHGILSRFVVIALFGFLHLDCVIVKRSY